MTEEHTSAGQRPPGRGHEGRLRRWRRSYLAYQRLAPLWRALYFAHPELQLLMPPGRLTEALTLRYLDRRLRRRVLEILDGERVLGEHLDPVVAAEARQLDQGAGLAELPLEAVVTAADLAAALQRTRPRLTLPRPGDGEEPADLPTAPGLEAHDAVNLQLEVVRLEAVAAAYTSSPIVRQALAATGYTDPERDHRPPR